MHIYKGLREMSQAQMFKYNENKTNKQKIQDVWKLKKKDVCKFACIAFRFFLLGIGSELMLKKISITNGNFSPMLSLRP